jgi:glycosyltransferase involved in cell wall biosynthesis
VKVSYKYADARLFLNQADSDFAIAHFPLAKALTRVTANGIPDSLLALGAPRRLSGGRLVVAQIGNYAVVKGVHYGSPALADVMARHHNVHVKFLGTGCSRDSVVNQFRPGLRDRIEVIPHYERDELPRLLVDCEIKFFPTLAEGFGMALVEAMACGLAPVSTMTPGPMSIIEPEVDGLLVPTKDTSALTRALERLITDEGLRFRIRQNAYRKAQGYSWDAVARQRVEIYREFLESGPTSRTGRFTRAA